MRNAKMPFKMELSSCTYQDEEAIWSHVIARKEALEELKFEEFSSGI
jgi:hypothetical protein